MKAVLLAGGLGTRIVIIRKAQTNDRNWQHAIDLAYHEILFTL